MSKYIEFHPPEVLKFKAPFTTASKETVKIENKDNTRILLFKVKTTAPKQYTVKPNAGRIEPNTSKEISIELQPVKEEPNVDFKSKDKFLIQCLFLNEDIGGDQNLSDLWTKIEKEQKHDLIEKKLRCNWILSDTEEDTPPSVSEPKDLVPEINQDIPDKDRRLKEALSLIENLQAERNKLQKELALFKPLDLTLRQKKEAEQFALSSTRSFKQTNEAVKFSMVFVIAVALLAFLLGLYI